MARFTSRLCVLAILAAAFAPASVSAAPNASPDGSLASPPERYAYLIRGGCTAGLDKVCRKTRRGKTVCHCQS